ncbi:MAG: glycerophosphodiester phosphodiesterase [Vicinamibacterales bacterium]
MSIEHFFNFSRPRVFAHRGCALGPENTLAAFDLGIAAGADGLEFDVQLSADGVPVVCHDRTLDRTTNLAGPVTARTAAELARVDAGYRFSIRKDEFPFRNQGVGIPTLSDVLRRYPDVPIIIEMKVNHPEMGRRVADEVRAAGSAHRTCAAGYGAQSLRAVREALPEMATSACHPEVRLDLYRSWARCPRREAPYGGYQVPELSGLVRVVSPRFIRDAHRYGRKVEVWTVDEPADMKRLFGWGTDGLISNRPDLAVRVRDALAASR